MRILLIDNYDSFTYNLVQAIGSLAPTPAPGSDLRVIRNDKITVEEAEAIQPTHIVLSPGPCTPRESGICGDLIEHFQGRVPILGVCLGHQTIADRHGMVVQRHSILMHGKTSEIHHDNKGVFRGLSNPFTATRYHSLIVDRRTLRDDFEISAWTDQGEIMGLRWTGLGSDFAPLEGVQFHPESFLTVEGPHLIANFLGVPQPPAASHLRDPLSSAAPP